MVVWLSIAPWLISGLALLYLLSLFAVAYIGQNTAAKAMARHPMVFALALGVSCSSWAFYGIIGQVSTTGDWLAPIYLGTIACFVLGWPLLMKLMMLVKQQNLTSIADFFASRYNGNHFISALVTLIALLATIPYMSLQLRAISNSFDLVTGSYNSGSTTTFGVALVLVVFSILFGARHIATNKQNPGLVLAIAFSSVIKLIAMLLLGVFATFFVIGDVSEFSQQYQTLQAQSQSPYLLISQIFLGVVTVFILPQQFHMLFIENSEKKQLTTARWVYPAYLIAINAFVLPIAIAGHLTFPGGAVNPDNFALTLPLFFQQSWLSIVVFIGGLAAATSMVIIAGIVLSNMMVTEILSPILIKLKIQQAQATTQVAKQLLLYRQVSIALVLIFALAFERFVDQQNHLSTLGLLAFALMAQLTPGLIAALFWRNATTRGATAGLVAGTLMWAYCLLIPMTLPNSELVANGLFNMTWLKPTAILGMQSLDIVSHGLVFSLLANLCVFAIVSIWGRRSLSEQIQADVFVNTSAPQLNYALTVQDLASLLQRFIDKHAALQFIAQYTSPNQLQQLASPSQIDFCRKQLASVLGTASSRLVMKAATDARANKVGIEDVAHIVDEANQLFEFNRELLQAAVENIEQGISVVDADMRLVAWNTRYNELLNYPAGFLQTGMHISTLLKFNVERGMIPTDDLDAVVERRVEHMKAGNTHYYQRILPSGTVIEIRGQAMPGGGFVSTFSDITKHIESEQALQKANETLEQRVLERTEQLERAKAEAETANRSKTRFLAAASHDLMQPFNALSLFTDMLKEKLQGKDEAALVEQIGRSLESVESLLADLVEISKLDGQSKPADLSPFALDELLAPLAAEINMLASSKGITFKYQPSRVWVRSDKSLLRRVIQNFLSNALHYCNYGQNRQASVLLAVKRLGNDIEIRVYDNGPGIEHSKQAIIFKEFERLDSNRDVPGLGLGLAIAERIGRLLGGSIELKSTVGKGSMFGFKVPRAKPAAASLKVSEPRNVPEAQNAQMQNVNAIVIDNDVLLLSALSEQLRSWGCNVLSATSFSEWQTQQPWSNQANVIIADYHLDNGENGIDAVKQINATLQANLPCIICSADPSEQLRQDCADNGFTFITKPVKALGLKRLLKQLSH